MNSCYPVAKAAANVTFILGQYARFAGRRIWSGSKRAAKGKLHTFSIPQRPVLGIPVPFIAAIVELEEGPRLATNIVGIDPDPQNLRCDMDVEVVFEDLTDAITLPKFQPVTSAE